MSTAETIKAAVVFRLGCGLCSTARRHLEDVPPAWRKGGVPSPDEDSG